MKKVVLKWSRLTVLLKIQKMRFVADKLTENVMTFTMPDPSVMQIRDLATALEDAELDASQGGKDRTRTRDNALDAATAAMDDEVLYVQTVTKGDDDMTALAGMETQAVPQRWPEPNMPEGFKVRPGKLEGSVYMLCKATKYKKEYVFEMWVEMPGPDPASASKSGSWVAVHTQSSGRYQHEGLERGKIYRFRVYAKNAAGRSTASSEASCAAR